ncbi:MAG TPA: FAD-dependent oxidoreductase [Bradyrhizobium sp.]|nr:FAD-dependent oxidoreductase [Bradyrhizobium sp.]
MSEHRDRGVLVIGAGIVGLCTSYELARNGWRVQLFDPNPPGSQCSSGNAGALSSGSVAPLAMPGAIKDALIMLVDRKGPLHLPLHYWLQAAPWLRSFVDASERERVETIATALHALLKDSVSSHIELAAEIGCPELIRQTGQLHLYPDEKAMRKDDASWALKRKHGLRMEQVDAEAIQALEPAVNDNYRVGVYLPDEASVTDPLRYSQLIAAALQARGGEIIQAEISSLTRSGDQWQIGDGARSWRDRHVVISAGVWSGKLLAMLGYKIPLISQRGYHVQVARAGVSLSRIVVLADRKVFINPMREGLRIAGTVEIDSIDRPPNPARAMLLKEHARAGLRGPVLENETIWMGHRPCLPDSIPVLGAAPNHPNLWCAFGHGHLGLTGSANTAKLIARALMCNSVENELPMFSAGRFG